VVDLKSEKEVEHALASDVMTPFVYMLDSDAHFREVIALMVKKLISSVFIRDKASSQYYIITQTDIVHFLNNPNLKTINIDEVTAAEIMHGPVEMIEETTPIDVVIRYMTEEKRKRMLIGQGNKPVGVISTRDILMWNNCYFQTAKPLALLIIDQKTGLLLGRHIFSENAQRVDKGLIEIYSSAINAVSHMTNEVLHQQGKLKRFIVDGYAVLFEPYKEIIGALICDGNSIEMHQKLHESTRKFHDKYQYVIKIETKSDLEILPEMIENFRSTSSLLTSRKEA